MLKCMAFSQGSFVCRNIFECQTAYREANEHNTCQNNCQNTLWWINIIENYEHQKNPQNMHCVTVLQA